MYKLFKINKITQFLFEFLLSENRLLLLLLSIADFGPYWQYNKKKCVSNCAGPYTALIP